MKKEKQVIRKSIKPIYMMATKAFHKLGDISREKPSLCCVTGEDKENFYGHFVEGFGFIDVKFPKSTTRKLTEAEKKHYRKGNLFINNTCWGPLGI